MIKLPENYKPSEDEEYMNSKQLEYFRLMLVKCQQELLAESSKVVNKLKSEKNTSIELGDKANFEAENFVELCITDRNRKLLRKIGKALKRIENKDYGYCAISGEPIGIRRLKARPVATLSIKEQEKRERNDNMIHDNRFRGNEF